MAAIREWFALYGILFETMGKFAEGEDNRHYEDFLGQRLHVYLGAVKGQEALSALEKHFAITIPKDGGECHIETGRDALRVDITACPDHIYFAQTPYAQHRFGLDYCSHCSRVHQALAECMGLELTQTAPCAGTDGICGCSLCFGLGGREK